MSKVLFEISMSLDGYINGPNASSEMGLGEGGERLHEWLSRDKRGLAMLVESSSSIGASISGRRAYDHSWPSWGLGRSPGGKTPIFVVSHGTHEEAVRVKGSPFVFVNDGIESALAKARKAAKGKNVGIFGGADIAGQYINAGLVDEIILHVVPVLMGGGVRLFDNLDIKLQELKRIRGVQTSAATHQWFAVV